MTMAGVLMVEHRLIEKVVGLIGKEAERLDSGGDVDVLFLERAIDFVRTYTDRCHHAKEEEILFCELARKPLTAGQRKIMKDLERQHVLARQSVAKLEKAVARYQQGDASTRQDMIHLMKTLANFYPKHVQKEEKEFFLPCMEYFSEVEMTALLQEFTRMDQELLHEKYRQAYVELMKR